MWHTTVTQSTLCKTFLHSRIKEFETCDTSNMWRSVGHPIIVFLKMRHSLNFHLFLDIALFFHHRLRLGLWNQSHGLCSTSVKDTSFLFLHVTLISSLTGLPYALSLSLWPRVLEEPLPRTARTSVATEFTWQLRNLSPALTVVRAEAKLTKLHRYFGWMRRGAKGNGGKSAGGEIKVQRRE